jgi:LmbE family N-acetylglucosaminyl deacetylase
MALTARPVAFDGRSPGTAESAWSAAAPEDRAPALDLDGFRRLVVVSAHPDDETLGAAGLIGCLHARGAAIELIVASDGHASHPQSPTHRPADLGRRRRREMVSATAHLAPTAAIRWLGLPDGGLGNNETEIARSVGRVVGADAPATLVVAPWRADGHPDHEAVGRAVGRAVRGSGAVVVEFPIWAWLWATPDDPRLQPELLRVLRLPEGQWLRKQRAIAEHRSQIEPLSDHPADRPVLPAGFLDHFRRRHETFLPATAGTS